MEDNNDTVEQACEKLHKLGGEIHGMTKISAEDIHTLSHAIDEAQDYILTAHKREMKLLSLDIGIQKCDIILQRGQEIKSLKWKCENYKNVISYKNGLIAGLKACRDGECERIKFGAELCDGCHWQLSKNTLEAKDTEIASLRSLVKELADSLEPFSEIYCMRCYKYVEGKCTATKSDKCFSIDRKKLIAKAREVVK